MMKSNKLIIWDWNGTLLNDVNASICSMNSLLESRNISQINHTRYRDVFTFPVKEYYKKLGFNFSMESFEKLSSEYVSLYKKNSENSGLHIGAAKILDYFQMKNINQIIISAMEQQALEEQIKKSKIFYYFDTVIGLNNIYAQGKIENAKNYFKNNQNINVQECILIGDTYHDFEVSNVLNCGCILVDNGHQNLSKFKLKGNVKILNNLLEIHEGNIIN